MQNEEWNVSAVSLSPELVRLAQQKQARLDACLQAAENGNEAAITELGINYFYGINGVLEDPDAAFYWLSRTSPENAAGRCFLGACYVIGKGTKQDERTAAELFRDSAALGFPPAQYELGLCYEHGIGLERNMARAVELYALAAEQEDAQAQCALGNLYFTGNGVEQDRAHAAELYTRAAEQGDVQALSCLAECYEAGCGVPCDLDRAIALYDQAAALGDGYAHEEASRLRLLRNNRRRKWNFGNPEP